jgi:hypothetical protein
LTKTKGNGIIMNDEKDGVWRTINGAKVFIKNGQN